MIEGLKFVGRNTMGNKVRQLRGSKVKYGFEGQKKEFVLDAGMQWQPAQRSEHILFFKNSNCNFWIEKKKFNSRKSVAKKIL